MSEYSTGQEGPAWPSPTPTEKGVWDLQQVRDKQLLGTGKWKYDAPSAPSGLFVVGSNRDGVLGGNFGPQFASRSSPIQIGTDTDWSKVFENMNSGVMANAAMRAEGTLYMWGTNTYGTLGKNDNTTRSSPTQIPGTNWHELTLIGGDAEGMIASKTDGSLWVWGNNQYGTLGLNEKGGHATAQGGSTKKSSPTQLGATGAWNINKFKFSGYHHGAAAIGSNGGYYIWGSNTEGRLGQNQAAGNWGFAPQGISSPVQVGTEGSWDTVCMGGAAGCGGTKTDGTLWAWGAQYRGQAGQNSRQPDGLSSPCQIPGGNWSVMKGSDTVRMATKTDGTLWSWGYDAHGNLGLNEEGTGEGRSSPCQVGSPSDIVKWDTDNFVVGGNYFIAMKQEGSVWGCGRNTNGSFGINNLTEYSSPVQVAGAGTYYTLSRTYNTINYLKRDA